MEDTDDPINQAGFETVDPTLRAYIYGLVSAVSTPMFLQVELLN